MTEKYISGVTGGSGAADGAAFVARHVRWLTEKTVQRIFAA